MIPLLTNIPLALVLGVVASACFATGATMQHLGVERNFRAEGPGASRAMTLRRFLRLLKTPLWLLGTLVIGAGAAMHVLALTLGPLIVVQPIGILAVPFSILLAQRIFKHKATGVMWLAVVLTVLGIVAFTVLSAITAVKDHHEPALSTVFLYAGAIWLGAGLFALLGWKGPRSLANLAWAWAGAFLYGLASAFMKVALGHVRFSPFEITNPTLFWVSLVAMLVAYAVGAWIIQQAYASGPAEIVVGVMTTIDPVVAVVFGLVVLGEGRNITWPYALGMVVAALVSAYGVLLLSRHHPDAQKHQQVSPEGATAATWVKEDLA